MGQKLRIILLAANSGIWTMGYLFGKEPICAGIAVTSVLITLGMIHIK